MSYVFAVVVGSFMGMVAGYTITWVFEIESQFAQIFFGILSGVVFGGLIGSFVGDANATGASRHQFLVAAIFGVGGGIMGATKFKAAEGIIEFITRQISTNM
jgi:hypothetical protein